MVRLVLFAAALQLLFAGTTWTSEAKPPSQIDKEKISQYLRYAEGYTPGVKLDVADPSPTGSPELWAVSVRISLGPQSFTKTYYVTSDAKEIIGGKLWYLGESPFADTLKVLPTDRFSFGPKDAKVTIVVFSDFQCPYCRQLAQNLRTNIPKNYPKDVRVVFADFPLTQIHPWAKAMSEAALCVADGDNDRFWKFHDWVYEHQGEIDKDNLKDKVLAYAKDQKYDTDKIGACISSLATAPQVDETMRIGDKLEVSQTPVAFVNGRMLGGAVPWQTFDAVIKLELEKATDGSGTIAGKNQ